MSDKFDRLSHFGDVASLHALLENTPYNRLLGIGVAEEPRPSTTAMGQSDPPVLVLRFSPDLIGNTRLPAIHGGVIGAFLETTALATLVWASDSEFLPKTIDITFEYLRSGKPRDTFARATITKHGRRVASVRVEAWQEDPARPVAAAHGHFLIKPREDTARSAGTGV
jgi:acyl-coenzyme A thioesterase PaaI-like protein